MKPTMKTNECLRQIIFVRDCYPRILNLREKINKEHENMSKRYSRKFFEKNRDSLQIGLAVLMFRCLPPNDITFTKEPTDKNELIGRIPIGIVWKGCKDFDKVTLLNLENELYDLVDTPQNLPQYKNLMYNRFKEYLTYPKEIENEKTPYTQSLVDEGIISDYEQAMFVQDLNRFSFLMQCVVSSIRELYGNGNNVNRKQTKRPCFRDCIQYNDPDKLIQRLHQLIDGKSGADVGCVIMKAMQDCYLSRMPKKKEFFSEFGARTDKEWKAILKYMNLSSDNAQVRAANIIISIDE